MGELIPVSEAQIGEGLLPKDPQAPSMTTLEIEDRLGDKYLVDYYSFPKAPEASGNNVDRMPELAGTIDKVIEMARPTFPKYDEAGFENIAKKLRTFEGFDVVWNADRTEVVAFHVFAFADIEAAGENAKVMYVGHAGTRPDVQKRGITTRARAAVYENLQPDIVCGSSAQSAIYVANQHIAEQTGYVMYPTEATTDPRIGDLALKIKDAIPAVQNAEMDATRLVRTYPDPLPVPAKDHPVGDRINLGPNDHIFYMLVKPSLNEAVLSA